jgi:DNA-binding GntR family transcriptional regulator
MAEAGGRRGGAGAGAGATAAGTDAGVLAPVTRSATRTDLVTDAIRSAILSGRLRPGESLVERRLAEMLGVSKTPVREALIGLSSVGLVLVNPNRGVTVRALGVGDLRQVYEVRLLLEPWAVGRSALRRSAEALAVGQAALAEARTMLSADDRAGLSLANRRLHRALYASCGNDLVTARLDDLQDLTALGTVSLLWERWPTWNEEFGEHEEILAAVGAGDAAAAEQLVRRHIRRSLGRLDGTADTADGPDHDGAAAAARDAAGRTVTDR